MDALKHDVRFALRSIRRRPLVAITIILMLTLGIGANSAIFSAIDAVLLKPLPYPASNRLVAVYEQNIAKSQSTSLVAPARLEEWSRLARTFDGIAGSYFENMTDTTGTLPERVQARRVSPHFFSVLGTPAMIGRLPSDDEERFGGPLVVVLSDGFWHKRFNGDPAAIGRFLLLSDQRRTIIGVMPPSFRYPSATTDVWVPAQMPAGLLRSREARFFTGIGRFKPSVTFEQARQDLQAVEEQLGKQFPQSDAGWTASVVPLKEEVIGGVRRSLWVLFGAVVLVLFAACGNVACLLLAASVQREQDVAVRFALGAARQVIVRQLMIEGFILALAGAFSGLLVASWGIAAIRHAATRMPRVTELHVDLRIVLFTFALSVATTLLFAVAPALRTTRRDVGERLVRSGAGQIGGRQVLVRTLVATQVALAIVLLVGAGLLIQSFARLQEVPLGFEVKNVLRFRVSAAWAERQDDVANRQLRTLQRLATIPGVEVASAATSIPAGADADIPPSEFQIVGRDTGEHLFALPRQVTSDYFRTLRIPLLQGETCRDDQRVTSPNKVLVSRRFVERFFPGDNPIGHQIVQRFTGEIVGVVDDVRDQSLTKEPQPVIYFCGLLAFWPDPFYFVRTAPSQMVSVTAIREALHEIEPHRAVYSVAPLSDTISDALSQPRLNTILLTLFAGLALTLAAIGLYGTVAQFVSCRRREIAMRIVLGASPRQLLALVARHSALVTAAGVAMGLVGAWLAARFLTAVVFGVSVHDPLIFAVVPLVLAVVSMFASLVPAVRAIHVDPMQVLRDE